MLTSSFLFFMIFIHKALSFRSLMDPVTLNYTFTFPYFDVDDCGPRGSLLCMGGATVDTDGVLDLNPDHGLNGTTSAPAGGSVGRVLYKIPILVWPAMFTTTFTVLISENSGSTNSGDGMAFVFAPDNGLGPVGSSGGFLGLFNHTTNGHILNQLGIELDTFKNELDPPNGNHIGIDTKSIQSDVTFDLSDVGIDLKSGRDLTVTIAYNGWKNRLEISIGYVGGPTTRVLDHPIDLSVSFPKAMYVGFTGSTGENSGEKHRIRNWVLSSMPLMPQSGVPEDGKRVRSKVIIGLPVAVGCLFLLVLFLVFMTRGGKGGCVIKQGKGKREGDIESRSRSAVNGPKLFSFKELSRATQNFSKENLLGTGGFGSVYRGEISGGPSEIVAVKRISATSKQGEREFLAEISTIGRLRHKNIVQLLGWCHESRDHLLLVYQFMPNGSLDRFISKKKASYNSNNFSNNFLEWRTRYSILTGLASALLYLHEECGQTVVHRDVKPNNVMLDAEFNAHLGDFGLARLLHNEAPAVTTMLAGTPGYLAPECSYTGKATVESDVFSFGIVVLEVVCGRRSWGSPGDNNLVDHVWDLHAKGDLHLLQGVDPGLEGRFDPHETNRAMLLALACSHPDPGMRPRMRKVVHVLTNPNEPLVSLPESRPAAIYVPVLSPTASSTARGSMATTTSTFSNTQASLGDTSLEYSGR